MIEKLMPVFPYSPAEAAADSAHHRKRDDRLADEIATTEQYGKLEQLGLLLAGTTKGRRLSQLVELRGLEAEREAAHVADILPTIIEAARNDMEKDLAARAPAEPPVH